MDAEVGSLCRTFCRILLAASKKSGAVIGAKRLVGRFSYGNLGRFTQTLHAFAAEHGYPADTCVGFTCIKKLCVRCPFVRLSSTSCPIKLLAAAAGNKLNKAIVSLALALFSSPYSSRSQPASVGMYVKTEFLVASNCSKWHHGKTAKFV